MKNTQMIDVSKKRQIVYIIALACIVLLFSIFTILISVEISKVSINNIVDFSGSVSSVKIIGNADDIQYQITLDDGNTYQINNAIAQKIAYSELKSIENNDVVLKIFKDDWVLGIESATFTFDVENGLQIQRDNLKIGLAIVITGDAIFFVLLVGLVISTIRLPKQKQIDFLENFYQGYRITPANKSYKTRVIISIILIFAVFIPILIIEGNKNDTSTLFYAMFFTFLGLCLLWGVLAISLFPLARKKEIEFYAHMYDFEKIKIEEDTDNSFLDMSNDLLVKFEKTGISLDKENMRSLEQDMFRLMAELESTKDGSLDKGAYMEALKQQFNENVIAQKPNFSGVIPYEELKLGLQVVFRPDGSITPFIASDLPQDNKYNLKNDIFIEFSPMSYFYVKKLDIKVDGMNNFMKNRTELMKKYCKGKPNAQTIKD